MNGTRLDGLALGFKGSARGGRGIDMGRFGFFNALVGGGDIPRTSGVSPGTRMTTTLGIKFAFWS